MLALADFIQDLEHALTADDAARAEALITAAAADPEHGVVRRELGRAAVSAHDKDAALTQRHAQAAAALAPQEPLCHQYLAVAALMRGDRAAAESHARDAADRAARSAAVNDRGGSRRSLGWLGNILLGSNKVAEAEAVYRQMLELDPADEQALNGVGACRYKQQDVDGAVAAFARAYDAHPGEGGPIRSLMNLYGEAGRLLGAIALGNLHREQERSDEEHIALDLMLLQLTRLLVANHYPPPGADADADGVIEDLLRRAARRPVRVQLGVARALLDCERYTQARELVTRLESEPSLSATETGDLHYVRGLLLSHKSDVPGALEAYAAALEADPRRWDAACNATSLLLQRSDALALPQIAALIGRVPAHIKAAAPQLLFNEALYLRRTGQREAARKNLARVIAATREHGGELAALARQLLAEDEAVAAGPQA